jgi:NAD(P)H-dependent flavin oxidoreductase YrpB (nitropropane dioxygenase family)
LIALLGMRNGSVSAEVLAAVALAGVLSIFMSTLMISYSKNIYRKVRKMVGFFVQNKFNKFEENQNSLDEWEGHVVVIGAHRVGGQIVEFLKKEQIMHMVLDFNPDVIKDLSDQGVTAIYGDVGDPEILDLLKIEKARLIISTSQDKEDNLHLLSEAKRRRSGAAIVVRATSAKEARELYKAGADYVILPEIVSGDFFTTQLRTHWPNINFFKNRADIELRKISGNKLSFE